MGDEPSANAAIEFMRRGFRVMNERAALPAQISERVGTDFVFEDRRAGGVNFGRLDRSGWIELTRTIWEVGAGRPRMSSGEIVAVRGDRCAAFVEMTEYTGDMHDEHISVIRTDITVQLLERQVVFDLGDLDEAIAELDRMYAEIDD